MSATMLSSLYEVALKLRAFDLDTVNTFFTNLQRRLAENPAYAEALPTARPWAVKKWLRKGLRRTEVDITRKEIRRERAERKPSSDTVVTSWIEDGEPVYEIHRRWERMERDIIHRLDMERALGPELARIYEAHVESSWTAKEIAEAEGVPTTTIEERLKYARRILAHIFN